MSIKKEKHTNVYNPATGKIISKTPMCGDEELDKAVQAAEKAFFSWSTRRLNNKKKLLKRYDFNS